GTRDGDGAGVGRSLELEVLLQERRQQADDDQHHDHDHGVRPEVVREEGMRVFLRHVIGDVVPGLAEQELEGRQARRDRIEDVVGADREALVFRLERVTPAVGVLLHDLDLFGRDSRSRSFLVDLLLAHSGSDIPCARISLKWMYIKRTINAGSTNTCSVKKRCSVGGPTTGPPWSSSLMNALTGWIGMPAVILMVTSVAKYALVSHGSKYPVRASARMMNNIST